MIKEAYVSFETAKLLKEKGFNEDCYTFYEYSSKEFYREKNIPCCNSRSDDYAAPTQQMAIAWLIEMGIAAVPILRSILDNERFLWDIEITVAKTNETYHQGWIYESQERACEAAIKYCLENLI